MELERAVYVSCPLAPNVVFQVGATVDVLHYLHFILALGVSFPATHSRRMLVCLGRWIRWTNELKSAERNIVIFFFFLFF